MTRNDPHTGRPKSTEDVADAFDLLAHETRVAAMTALWNADEPLRFSEIADRAGVEDTGNFNYHLGKLVGAYVREHEGTYRLSRSGRQAMTAVAAGDVIDHPTFERSLSAECPFCGATVELRYDEDTLRVRCTNCPGLFEPGRETPQGTANPRGTLSTFDFPPSGIRDRPPEAVLSAALTRHLSQYRDYANGLCPECAGPIERTASICTDHDDEGVCDRCASRFAGELLVQCPTCRRSRVGLLALLAVADGRVQRTFADRGIDLATPSWADTTAFLDVDERVDDGQYRAIWTFEDGSLEVRIDDATVVGVSPP